jgi:hypothetical protein
MEAQLNMKQALLMVFCLMLTLFLLPDGMASWGGDLFIGGTVTTGEFLNDDDQPEEKWSENLGEEDRQDKKLDAPLADYVLTIIISGQGDTTLDQGSYVYKQGQEIKLIAKPTKGWIFNKWLIGESELNDPKIVFNINNDISVEAVFIKAVSSLENEEEVEGENDDNGDLKYGINGAEEPLDQGEPLVDSGDFNVVEQ